MFGLIIGILIGGVIVLWLMPENKDQIRQGEVLHKKHYRGQLAGGDKFVYCPIGRIVSWHPKDYDHKYCAYCRIFYEPI
jgi:hypothetical protein